MWEKSEKREEFWCKKNRMRGLYDIQDILFFSLPCTHIHCASSSYHLIFTHDSHGKMNMENL